VKRKLRQGRAMQIVEVMSLMPAADMPFARKTEAIPRRWTLIGQYRIFRFFVWPRIPRRAAWAEKCLHASRNANIFNDL